MMFRRRAEERKMKAAKALAEAKVKTVVPPVAPPVEPPPADVPPVEPPPAEPPVDLSTLKVPELRALAQEKGIEGIDNMKRAELIAALSE